MGLKALKETVAHGELAVPEVLSVSTEPKEQKVIRVQKATKEQKEIEVLAVRKAQRVTKEPRVIVDHRESKARKAIEVRVGLVERAVRRGRRVIRVPRGIEVLVALSAGLLVVVVFFLSFVVFACFF